MQFEIRKKWELEKSTDIGRYVQVYWNEMKIKTQKKEWFSSKLENGKNKKIFMQIIIVKLIIYIYFEMI